MQLLRQVSTIPAGGAKRLPFGYAGQRMSLHRQSLHFVPLAQRMLHEFYLLPLVAKGLKHRRKPI